MAHIENNNTLFCGATELMEEIARRLIPELQLPHALLCCPRLRGTVFQQTYNQLGLFTWQGTPAGKLCS